MNSFFTDEELKKLGFRSCGEGVLLSRKASIYGAEHISLGSHVRIDDFCIISGKIEIGSYVHIAAYTALYGGTQGIYIEDFANLSSRISVYAVSDDYSGKAMTNPTIPKCYKNVIEKAVRIERHVIVGATSVILPGTTLHEGSAFGCFSMVNRDSEPWSYNVGIPFRKLRERSRDLLELETQFVYDCKKGNVVL